MSIQELTEKYITLRAERKRLDAELADVAKQLKTAAADGPVRCDAGTVKIIESRKAVYEPRRALQILNDAHPIHGAKAAEIATSVDSRGVQDALAYLEARGVEIEPLVEQVEGACKWDISQRLSVAAARGES